MIKKIFPFLLAIILLATCKSKKDKEILKADPAFNQTIAAYTSGVISKKSVIRIRLVNEYDKNIDVNKEIEKDLFSFNPKMKGIAYWLDNRTIEFQPEKDFESGTTYEVEFDLHKIMDVPDELKVFKFGFRTITQNLDVKIENYSPYNKNDLTSYRVAGTLLTSDVANENSISSIVEANQDNKRLPLTWKHDPDQKVHHFVIDSVSRGEKSSELTVTWNGKEAGIDSRGEEILQIPALGDFKMMDIQVVQQPEQYISMQFSDPLQKNQNLRGLITLSNNTSLSYTIDDNIIKAYPAARQTGTLDVQIAEGIKNILGYKLKEGQNISLAFEDIKPNVRLVGKGVILPNSEGLIFPFEAVNLKAVDVKIIRIYENNVAQFMQVNHLDGENQLKRVGRFILKKEIQLVSEKPIDYGRWNLFSLDLAELIHQEPGALYRVEISFRKKHSLYPCAGGEEDETELEESMGYDEDYDEDEISYWDSYEDYYNEYDYNYNWRDRKDPCTYSYYRYKKVARNFLASDLGIIAKAGNNRGMKFAVTNLVTGTPLEGVDLEILNYQQQVIGTATTGSDGLASVLVEQKPYLLIAKSGDQRGYLRMDDGSSLSLSYFDVSGNVVQKGIKGYIYGERGVWRPGDTLYLNFIMEDQEKILPGTHPVVFELINPMGQLYKRMVRTTGENGFYSFIFATEPESPTGNWTAKIKVGGTSFTKILKIETIKPNRIKIKIDFGVEKLTVSDRDISATLKANWLHGAPARKLRATVDVTLGEMPTQFDKYANFVFDDPARDFYAEEKNIFDGYLNEQGEARVSAYISTNDASPGMLKASFVSRVYEEGGEFSTDRFSIPYAPYDYFVGIKTPRGDKARGMLLTDTSHVVDVVTLDAMGNPVSRDNIDCKVYKVSWRWWWDASADNDLASYIGNTYNSPVHSEVISTKSGKGSFSFRVNYPDWGRYLVRVKDRSNGHATGKIVYIDWPGWAGRAQRENPGGAAMLTFSADKKTYTPGEFCTVSFPGSENSRALVSIESGSKIVDAWWVDVKKGENTFNFKVTPEMAPNVYINMTLVQPHTNTANDLPIRLYGIVPIMIEDPATKLQPVINMPDILEPEEEFTVKVSEKDNKKMTYTLAVVDEGLLDLTRFLTPNPWQSFYAREALGVKTWDIYDMVLGAYGGKIQQLLSIGGGDDADGSQNKRANRFKPVVMHLGPFTLNKGKSNSHTITMPNYVGSVRTMIVAGNEGAYGNTEKTTPVRKPLMVLATLPRVLGPGEEVKLPVTVFAMEDNIKKVNVSVETSDMLTIAGNKTAQLDFSQPGDEVVYFNIRVPEKTGIATAEVKVKSGREEASYKIEIEIRNPNPDLTKYQEAVIDPGKEWTPSYMAFGMPGTNKGTLEISSIPPIDFGRRLKYLLEYPHGCIEQTTSSAFPQLYLGDVMELTSAEQQKTKQNIMAAIERINTFMLPSGGLGYWPGAVEETDWGTSYAGHFMIEAEKKGYNLTAGFRQKWVDYQKRAARSWARGRGKYQYARYNQSDLEQAYRLYTLALAGENELGAMNRLREKNDLSLQAKWRLAAAYGLAGKPEVANEIIENLSTDINEYPGFYSSFGSRERDWAMIMETFIILNDRNRAMPLMERISKVLSGKQWMSTQTTAYCLLSMSKFAGETTSKEMKFNYAINDGEKMKATTKLAVSQHEIDMDKYPEGNIRITNRGEGVLFARIILEGKPVTDNREAEQNDLTMSIAYKDMEDNPIDVTRLQQGTDFKAEVTLKNPGVYGYYKDMALTQIFPSGWEIHNMRVDGNGAVHRKSVPDYEDVRDDRVYTYFDLQQSKSKTFVVLLNAAYLGKFYMPAVSCEAMYENKINARIPGKWVEVVKPQ